MTWIKIWMFTWNLDIKFPENVPALIRRCCCGKTAEEEAADIIDLKYYARIRHSVISHSSTRLSTHCTEEFNTNENETDDPLPDSEPSLASKRSRHSMVVAHENRPHDILSFFADDRFVIDDRVKDSVRMTMRLESISELAMQKMQNDAERKQMVPGQPSNFPVSFTNGKDELVISYDDDEEKEDDSDNEEENNTANKPSIFGRYDNAMENIKEEQTDIVYDDEKRDNEAVVSKGDIELQPMPSEPVIVEEIEKEISGGIANRLALRTGLKTKETQRNSRGQQMDARDGTIMDDNSDDIEKKVDNVHISAFFRIPMISLFDICIFVRAQDHIVEEEQPTETEKEYVLGNEDGDQTQSEMEPQIEAEDEKGNGVVDVITVELDAGNQMVETNGSKKKTSSQQKKSSKKKTASKKKTSSKLTGSSKKKGQLNNKTVYQKKFGSKKSSKK